MVARPHVVIVGGGFGGLAAARGLRNAPVDVTLIDRTNHYLFQPLLYQVATGVLSPADVAMPLRHLLRRQSRTRVLLADVNDIDLSQRVVRGDDGRLELRFDFLIVGAGARHSYFGRPEWEPIAPGLKTLDDAREIRRRFLLALEQAEKTNDDGERQALLTIVIIGGGPTGVELAGILPTIARQGFRHDFRRIDPREVRVILLEGGPRLLPAFPEALSRRALRDLGELGVQCRTNALVTRIAGKGVWIGEEHIATRTILWAAGNVVSPLVRKMGIPVDRSGRAMVLPDLSVPDHPHVFVVGDAAAVPMHNAGRLDTGNLGGAASALAARGPLSEAEGTRNPPHVPALAAAARQMGEHAARTIRRTLAGKPRPSFRYRDKGTMAVIGRGRAVADFGWLRLTGPVAFYTWLFVHLLYLAGFRNRLSVLLEWSYAYFTYQPGARLITAEDAQDVRSNHDGNPAESGQGPTPSRL